MKVNSRILKTILCSTGSQCISFSKGVIRSYLEPHEIWRTAQFWTNWSLWIKYFGSPYKRELQLSNLHITKACAKNFGAFSWQELPNTRNIANVKKVELQMTATWRSMFKLLSKITLMLLAEWMGFITEPSTAVKEKSWETGLCCNPMTKSSVLSQLSLSLFKDNHFSNIM